MVLNGVVELTAVPTDFALVNIKSIAATAKLFYFTLMKTKFFAVAESDKFTNFTKIFLSFL